MQPSTDKLLEEYERISLDDQLYLRFVSDEDIEVCIQFKKTQPRPWSVWFPLSEEASRQSCSRQHLLFVLKAFRVDERKFHSEVTNALLTQASYADEFVRQVAEILGEEAVRNGIRDTQKFMSEMSKLVDSLIAKNSPQAPKGPPTLVPSHSDRNPPDDPEPPKPGKGKLKILRS